MQQMLTDTGPCIISWNGKTINLRTVAAYTLTLLAPH